MNYRHSYHAGNFADVFKHIILVALIEALKQRILLFVIWILTQAWECMT